MVALAITLELCVQLGLRLVLLRIRVRVCLDMHRAIVVVRHAIILGHFILLDPLQHKRDTPVLPPRLITRTAA